MKYNKSLFLVLIGVFLLISSYQDIRYVPENKLYEIKTKLGPFLGTLLISLGLVDNINKLDGKLATILFFVGLLMLSYGNSQLHRGHIFLLNVYHGDYGIMTGSIFSFILFFVLIL